VFVSSVVADTNQREAH